MVCCFADIAVDRDAFRNHLWPEAQPLSSNTAISFNLSFKVVEAMKPMARWWKALCKQLNKVSNS